MALNNKPWSLDVPEALAFFGSNANGLKPAEAKARLAASGPNEIQREKTATVWSIFIRQFTSPLIMILIGASAIAYSLGDRAEVVIILSMVAVSGCLAFIQEYRSEIALRMLRKKLTRYAIVIRDGKPASLDARELVVGDLIRLELGTVVAADVRLIEIDDLEIDESMLTGESIPVAKSKEALGGARLNPQEQVNMAFMGTNVVQGSATGLVVAIASQTEMGRTATLLAERPEETDFQKGVRGFGGFLLKITISLILFASLSIGLLRGDWIESVLFALALAIGISPEMFPMIVTVNLSRGAIKMNKKHVLVKKLISIEDLGNADVFCTDKTGTLTVGTMRASGSMDAYGNESPEPLAYASHCLTLDAMGRATNPVDQAILEAARHQGTPLPIRNAKNIETISFDYTRRRMSCVVGKKAGERRLIVKGAINEMLAVCTCLTDGNKIETLNQSHRQRIQETADQAQDQGYRLIAVALRAINVKQGYGPDDEKDLNLLGFVRVYDPPKHTAKPALSALQKLGVRIVILTGDTERITRHVAKELGFKISGLFTGEQIALSKAEDLGKMAEKANVFTNITPEQKLRIIQALKQRGHTVGFMGDGVNDAPSLRAADAGISFDSAVDVAKEAASIIMLKKNLSVLTDGIREGRRTFMNTQTYINTTISSNFGNMLSLAGVSLLLPFLPMLPAQILLLNLLSDLPLLGITSDRVADEDLVRPHSWNIKSISRHMYFFGIISSIADFMTFGMLYFLVGAGNNLALFRSGWFLESLLECVVVIFLLRSRRTSLSNLPSKTLTIMCAFSVALTLAIIYSPLGSDAELVGLPVKILAYIVLIVIGYGLMVEIGKRMFYKYLMKEPAAA